MNARIASNVETAALLPEGASVTSNQAKFSNIEQARADYLHELVAFGTREVAASLGVPRSALVGSREAAAEVMTARFFRGK